MSLMNYEAAAGYLSVPVELLQQWVQDDVVPFVRLPTGLIRFDPERLESWVGSQTQGPTEPAPAPGNAYGEMELSDFYEQVWSPYRREHNPGTWKRERCRWRKILAELGDVPVCALSRVRWDAFLRSMTTWGGTARRLAQNEYRLLLKYAKEIGAISEVHTFAPIRGATKRQREPEPLTQADVDRILDHAHTPMHRALFATAFGQGTRKSEVTKLRWEHCDFERGVLRISGTKNDLADAVVPMTDMTMRELGAYWHAQGEPEAGWCFTWRGKPIRSWKTAFKATARRAGGDELAKKVFPNLCRHTFATQMVKRGVPRPAARKMMRHAHDSVILERAYQVYGCEETAEAVRGVWEE